MHVHNWCADSVCVLQEASSHSESGKYEASSDSSEFSSSLQSCLTHLIRCLSTALPTTCPSHITGNLIQRMRHVQIVLRLSGGQQIQYAICPPVVILVFTVFASSFICFNCRAAGEIFAVSLGPAPKFLQEWCYNFLLTGNLENLTRDDVYELQFSSLIKMVCCMTNYYILKCTHQ